jgi:hypothetical protein
MHVGFNTYLAALAIACAQQEIAQGITNLSTMEQAEIIVSRPEFVDEVRKEWVRIPDVESGARIIPVKTMDEEFEDFVATIDPDDLSFLAAAFRA